MTKVVCITHRKDVDGIASAALLKRTKSATVILADYEDLVEKLRATKDASEVYVCDLSTNEKIFDEFLLELSRLAISSQVCYVDHHPISDEMLEKIRRAGVEVIHSDQECTSVLLYMKFKENLPNEAGVLAAYGAVTDYRDGQPLAKRIIESYDRQFILLEGSMLSYALAYKGRDSKFVQRVVEALSELRYPHEIQGVPEYAREQATKMVELLQIARLKGKKRNNYAYLETDEAVTGNVANFLIGAFRTHVGVAFRRKGDAVEVSLRASESSRHDLGKVIAKVASKLGGSGGGHPRASGAYIPSDKMKEFLDLLDEELE